MDVCGAGSGEAAGYGFGFGRGRFAGEGFADRADAFGERGRPGLALAAGLGLLAGFRDDVEAGLSCRAGVLKFRTKPLDDAVSLFRRSLCIQGDEAKQDLFGIEACGSAVGVENGAVQFVVDVTKDEIADLALFLCSDGAQYITGAICVCDGGQSLLGSRSLVPAMVPQK